MAKAAPTKPKTKKRFKRASDMINATNLAEDEVVDWHAVALEEWIESPEFEKLKKAKTKAELTEALKKAFTIGWTAFDNQPQCSCRRPERGGDRDGSALCAVCYEREEEWGLRFLTNRGKK